jgi:Cof subfamily protein (haloacid dehalogenase superfamily)
MEKPRTRYLFFDIDGTVARGYEPIPERVTANMRRCRRQGHKLFLCTARTWCDLHAALWDAGFDGVVAGAGAQVCVEGNEIFHGYIPEKTLQETVALMRRHRFSGVLEGTDEIYFVPGEVELTGKWPILPENAPADAGLKIEKFTIHTNDAAHIQRVLDTAPQLREWYDVYPNNEGSLVEFVNRGVTKESGIRRVLAYYGAKREDSVFFGDSRNDLSALVYAGFGVAMGNAPDEVKKSADYVTGTFEEDGVALALERLGFCGL